MTAPAAELLDPVRLAARATAIDRERAGTWGSPRPAPGGTAVLAAVDSGGRAVALIQSSFSDAGRAAAR